MTGSSGRGHDGAGRTLHGRQRHRSRARGSAGAAPGPGRHVAARRRRRRRPGGRADHASSRPSTVASSATTRCGSTSSPRWGSSAVAASLIAGFAQRLAVVRLGVRSEQALYDLRARLIAPHPPPQPRRPQRGAPRCARRPGDERHRDARPVLPVGRPRVAARRHVDADRRRRDARLRLDPRPRRVRRRRCRSRSCCASCSATSSPPTTRRASATPRC